MRLYLAGVPFSSKGDRDRVSAAINAGKTDFLFTFGHVSGRQGAEIFIEDFDKLRLYQAGSFAGGPQKGMLYSTGPQNVLFSYAHAGKPEVDPACAVLGPEGQERMRLYLAGDWSPALHEKVCDLAGEKNLLCTNAARASRERADYFGQKKGYQVLVDSGAFTAWKQGTPIVLSEYIEYAQKLQAIANEGSVEFIGLDIIAGTFEARKAGTLPTLDETHLACQQGIQNYLDMEMAGVPCIPTFHRDDPFEYLDQMCDYVIESPSKRLCLAPRVDGSPTSVKMNWLNQCYKRLIERYGERVWENFKIHGLGISSIEMMETYPFFSVDSTGWLWASVNTTYKQFDGLKMQTWQKTSSGEPNNWHRSADRKKWPTLETIQCIEKYRAAKSDAEAELVGSYWYGAQAIVADVRLEKYISRLWAKRGVVYQ